ncbi:hypothetical protein ABWH93_06630 [Seohaeicola saemankumensis]|uniref:hypothetical protein n=1 Tax=Seohaeicola saemankumensis TaxID=481181 RepID=UPI0035D0AFFD
MPGFAPLAAVPLGSVGGFASRQAAAAGSLALQGQAHVGLRASGSAEGIAPGFTGKAAAGGTVEASGSFSTAVITGQAQGDTATRGIATGAILSLEGTVGVRATTTAAAVGTLGTVLLARSSPVSAIRADGAVPLDGAQDATSRVSGSAAPLWQVLSHADAAAAINGQVFEGRLLPLEGTGQGHAAPQAQGFGTVDLGGDARLAVAALAHAESGVTAAGTAMGILSLGLTLASDFGLTGAASGISLRVREASASVEIGLQGQSTGALLLNAGLVSLYAWQGAAQGRGTVQAQSSGVIDITRASAVEVHVGATAGRLIPLGGGAAAHSVSRVEAQSAVVSAGLGLAVLTTRVDISGELASELVAAAETGTMARASGTLGTAALFEISAPIGLVASDRLGLGLDARGLSLAAARTAEAGLLLDGQARAALLGAAAADARLAVQVASAGHVGLWLTAEPQLALAASMAGRAGLRADLQGPVAILGSSRSRLEVSAGSQTASLPLAGSLRADLVVRAAAQGQIAFARDSLGEVGIDAVSVPALELGLVATGRLATHGTSADILAVNGVSGAAVALACGLQDQLALDGTAATLVGVTSLSRSDVPLSGVAYARATTKALVFGSFTVARNSDATVAVSGRAQPALPLLGAAVLSNAITATSSDGALPVALVARVLAEIAAAAGSVLTVTGAATAGLAIAGQSVGELHVGRDGSADVAIAGETARVIAFPGRGSAAVANDAGTVSVFLVGLSGTGASGILMRLVGEAIQGGGNARSSVAIVAAVQDEPLSTMLLARGFRAPPGLRRRATPDTVQSGSVMSHGRGGILLSELRTGRILRG